MGSPLAVGPSGLWQPTRTLLCELRPWGGAPGPRGRGTQPSALCQAVVEGLLSLEEDHSLLLSQFREYLEYDDVRYHTMQAATATVARVTDGHPEVSGLGRVSGGGGAGSGCVESSAQARSRRCPSFSGTTPSPCYPP